MEIFLTSHCRNHSSPTIGFHFQNPLVTFRWKILRAVRDPKIADLKNPQYLERYLFTSTTSGQSPLAVTFQSFLTKYLTAHVLRRNLSSKDMLQELVAIIPPQFGP